MIPVWRDVDWAFAAPNPVKYEIDNEGETVYTGMATPRPNEENVTIRISEFAKNIVNSDCELYFGSYEETFELPNYCKQIGCKLEGQNRLYGYFINDYDYNFDSGNLMGQVHIIGSHTDQWNKGKNGQIGKITKHGNYLFTIFNPTNTTFNITITNTKESNGYRKITWYDEYPIRAKQALVFMVCGLEYEWLNIEIPEEEFVMGRFKVVDSCNQYNLHYLNAAGGYSTLALEGKKGKRIDDFTFDYFKTRGHINDYNQPQMHKYKVDITPKWELQTGWLSDEDSQLMYNVFGSQKMWLEDNETGKIYPVYITNTNCEYKTFTNQGRKKYNYSISLTSANTLIKL